MKLIRFGFHIISIALLFATVGLSQTEAMKPSIVIGDVSAINSADRNLILQTKEGPLTITFSTETVFKKVPPGNPKLSEAVPSLLSEILIGDKLAVSGFFGADKKSFRARSIYLMAKTEIAKKIETDRAQWKSRGISGRVSAINSLTREVTITIRGFAGERRVVIKPKESAVFKRYAPDSANFDEAKPSSFAEVLVNDQLIALGDKGSDGTTFSAEQIVSGTFKMVGGTITAIDAVKKEITVKDIQTNKPTTIALNDSTLMKKFPAEFAQMLVMQMGAGAPSPSGQNQKPNDRPTQGREGSGGRGEFDEMINNFKSITLSELKNGDAIAISTTSGSNATRVVAIKLLAGVELFFRAAAMGAGRGGNRQGGQGVGGGFSIPGLDGFGFP